MVRCLQVFGHIAYCLKWSRDFRSITRTIVGTLRVFGITVIVMVSNGYIVDQGVCVVGLSEMGR